MNCYLLAAALLVGWFARLLWEGHLQRKSLKDLSQYIEVERPTGHIEIPFVMTPDEVEAFKSAWKARHDAPDHACDPLFDRCDRTDDL